MTQYNVTPEYVQKASVDYFNVSNDVWTQLMALKQFVMGLGAQWLGVSSVQFNELMNNFQVYSQTLHDALIDISEGLRGNYATYVDTEQDNLGNLVAIDGGLGGPPADPGQTPADLRPAHL